MQRSKRVLGFVGAAVVAVAMAACTPPPPAPDPGTDTTALREAVTVDGVTSHLQALQDISDENGGNRSAGTPGYEASADYVADLLSSVGYRIDRQPFSYVKFEETTPSELEQTGPSPETYTYLEDHYTMDYSGTGEAEGALQAVDLLLPPTGGSTSGCEASDFAGFTAGNIALVQRGSCDFRVKVENAIAADAVGVIVFNEGNEPGRSDLFGGTLSTPAVAIPVLTASFAFGVELNDQIAGGLTLRMKVDATNTPIDTENVIATSSTGAAGRQIVVGAHLDSVSAGPGINDNGTGTATNLEVALVIAELGIQPQNQLKFAFWGGEEDGLLGSTHYVENLTARQLANTELNLNFDMLGSTNFVRFVYDGDGDAFGTTGPVGSSGIEKTFNDYFASQGLATSPTAFDGRSDYKAFIDNDIPAGGLFSGAESAKTAEEAVIYGGTAGVAYDACYHQACDTIANVNNDALDQMSDAVAHTVLVYADADEPPTDPAPAAAGQAAAGGGASVEMAKKGNLFTS